MSLNDCKKSGNQNPLPQDENKLTKPLVTVRPSHGWAPIDFRVLWEYRELLYFLVWRDITVR